MFKRWIEWYKALEDEGIDPYVYEYQSKEVKKMPVKVAVKKSTYSVYVAGYPVQNVQAVSSKSACFEVRKALGNKVRIMGARAN